MNGLYHHGHQSSGVVPLVASVVQSSKGASTEGMTPDPDSPNHLLEPSVHENLTTWYRALAQQMDWVGQSMVRPLGQPRYRVWKKVLLVPSMKAWVIMGVAPVCYAEVTEVQMGRTVKMGVEGDRV